MFLANQVLAVYIFFSARCIHVLNKQGFAPPQEYNLRYSAGVSLGELVFAGLPQLKEVFIWQNSRKKKFWLLRPR